MSVGSSKIFKMKERVRKVLPYELDEPTWTKYQNKQGTRKKTQLVDKLVVGISTNTLFSPTLEVGPYLHLFALDGIIQVDSPDTEGRSVDSRYWFPHRGQH
jgi:hypothetical protein